MSKIHLPQNSEIGVAVLLVTMTVIVILLNIVVVVPGLVYFINPAVVKQNQDTIDTTTVNEAVKLLQGQ